MSLRRAFIILSVLVTLLPVVVVLGYPALQTQLLTSRQLASGETYTVTRTDLVVSIAALGHLEPEEVSNLTFAVSGQVTELFVKAGDFVEAGTPLALLDNRDAYLEYEQANWSYEAAIRTYQDLLSVDENALRIAEANLQAAQNAYVAVANTVTPEMIAAAELQYQQAQEALRGAEAARRQADPGRQSPEAIALLDAQIGEASFNAEIARLQLEELKTVNRGELGAAGARITQAQAELDRVRAGASSFQLEQAQAAIDQAAMMLEQAQINYEQTLLTAPFDGVIASVNIEVGQRVSALTPAIQLVDISPLYLKAEIDEMDLSHITEGEIVRITFDALPGGLFEGTVHHIDPAGRSINGLTVYEVEISLSNANPHLRPGMSGDAAIDVERLSDVPVVPNDYIEYNASGTAFVRLRRLNGTLEERVVTLGAQNEQFTEIVSGLNAGDVIVNQDQ